MESTDDSGYICWKRNDNKWCICPYDMDSGTMIYPFDAPVTFNGELLKPYGVPVNDNPCWVGPTNAMWYGHCRSGTTTFHSWIIAVSEYTGQIMDVLGTAIPFWYNTVTTTPNIATYNPSAGASGTYTASIDMWERWISYTQYGRYSPEGTVASGYKYIGLPQFRSAGVTYVRSLNKDGPASKYTYGEGDDQIYFSASLFKWVIGTPWSTAGWWEGSGEPDIDAPTIFTFTTLPEQEFPPVDNDRTISFEFFIRGNAKTTPIYYGEAAIWRT